MPEYGDNEISRCEADEGAVGNTPALIAGLDQAYLALREARTDFERLQIRDQARAAQAAAEILKRRDIQVEASILVAAAERAIAAVNPPEQGRRTDLGSNFVVYDHEVPRNAPDGQVTNYAEDEANGSDNFVVVDHEVDPQLVRDIRRAHHSLTDEQFDELKDKARESGEPITRSGLRRIARKLNPPEPSDEPRPPTRTQVLESERAEAIAKQSELRAEVEELKERIAFLGGESEPVEAVREERFNAYREEIRVLRISVQDWQKKYRDLQGLTRRVTPRCSNGHQVQAMYWRSAHGAFLCDHCDHQLSWVDNLNRLLQATGTATNAPSPASTVPAEEYKYVAVGPGEECYYEDPPPDFDLLVEDIPAPEDEDYEEGDFVPPVDAWEATRWLDGFRVGEYVVVDDGQLGVIQDIENGQLMVRLDNGIGDLVPMRGERLSRQEP